MLSDCENTLSILEMELETLKSIYVNELIIECENEVPATVALWLYPATADKVDEQYVRIYLTFKLTEKYPEDIPEINVCNTRGLSDEQIIRICEKLVGIAESRRGVSMLFELIEAAKEQLTSENRPSDNCAICLFEFLEEDVITKTECYHYFHSHCLNCYVESKFKKDDENDECDNLKLDGKTVCPVCRIPITFEYNADGFPEPAAESLNYTQTQTSHSQRNEMEDLYQKQLAQGGIIDVEAEKNKFLLEISNVPTTREPETPSTRESASETLNTKESVSEKDNRSCDKSTADSNQSSTSFKKANQTSPGYRNRAQGGYRQATNSRNYDRRERRRYSPNVRNQNYKPNRGYDNNSSAACDEFGDIPIDQLSISENTKDSVGLNHHSVDDERTGRRSFNYPQRYNRYGSRNQNERPKRYYNKPPNKPYRNHSYKDSRHTNETDGTMENESKVSKEQPCNAASECSNLVAECKNESTEKIAFIRNNHSSNDSGSKEEESQDYNKPTIKKFQNRNQRPNYRNQRFRGNQSHQPKFQRNWHNANGVGKFGNPSKGFGETENDTYDVNYDSQFSNPRKYGNQPPRYRGYYKSYRSNTENMSHNEIPERDNNSRSYREFPPASRYRENPHSSSRTYNAPARNDRSKTAVQSNTAKPEGFGNAQSSSDNVIQHPPHGTSAHAKPRETPNPPAESSGANPSEKNITGMVRPPPGFANPAKKLVYGLPSVNPPPGFSQS